MKFIHLADLHIGKKVNDFSMIEDQEYILKEIIKISDMEKPDGVIIAGDIYDKSVPPAEAVQLFDYFLDELSKRNLKVFAISGNHDSPERIAFGNKLMEKSNVYMSPVYNGSISPHLSEDEYGKINIYMLPFIKPCHVKRYFEDYDIKNYNDAMKLVIENMNIDKNERNILITHQLVLGAERSDSEEISVGGIDSIDVNCFTDFDYVALGHIHRPQNCKGNYIRYSGTPLKYSFSESKDEKSVTVLEIKEKGNVEVRTIPLVPLRDMVEIKGKYEDIVNKDFYKDTNYANDYMHITLTDEEDIIDGQAKLRTIYHNLMKLDYDNKRTRSMNSVSEALDVENKSPLELFSEFYEKENNSPMSEEQEKFIKKLIEEIWEGKE